MSIAPEFLIKHVRPYEEEGYELMCGSTSPGSIYHWLRQSNVPAQEINIAFGSWRATANEPIEDDTVRDFVKAAELISEARWTEFYATELSTIVFLNAPLLKELSLFCERHPNGTVDFYGNEYMPIAVTIPSTPGADAQVVRSVAGMRVGVDAHGRCAHFAKLLMLDARYA